MNHYSLGKDLSTIRNCVLIFCLLPVREDSGKVTKTTGGD